jgi:hypothetical protein
VLPIPLSPFGMLVILVDDDNVFGSPRIRAKPTARLVI